MRILSSFLLASLLGVSSLSASTQTSLLPEVQREVVAFVTGSEASPSGPPVTILRLWVRPRDEDDKERWIRLRVPGKDLPDAKVRAAGFVLPKRGDWIFVRLRTRAGTDWLLSSPQDLRLLRRVSWLRGGQE